MKNINYIILLSLLLILTQSTKAQEKWSLEKCISHAIENNITIKQQALNTSYYENQLKQSKFNLLPDANASIGHSLNLGRSLTQNNTYDDKNSQNIDLSISSSVVLFNGLAKKNTIKQRDFDHQAALQDLAKAKDDISLRVVSQYLQILFNKELVTTSKKQLNLTKQQIEYNEKMVEAGSLAKGKLFETEAQLAREELNLTNYENELNLSFLELKQLLEIESSENFDIVIPEFNQDELVGKLLETNDIFNNAVTERPEILSREMKLKSMYKKNQISKAQLYPSLSAGVQYYTNFNNNYRYINSDYTQGDIIPFNNQIKNNRRTNLYVSLKIPIFNGLSARNNYKNSIINYKNTNYELQLAKNKLRKEIEQVHTNAIASMKKYYSSEKAVKSAQEAFRYIQEKFTLGVVTPLEYNDSKNKVTNAQSSFIQAKYEYIFKIKILDFYNGKPLTL